MAYSKDEEIKIQQAIRKLTDKQILEMIEQEMTEEDLAADRKMKAALDKAPPQLKRAWQMANDALGMMPLRSLGTPLNEKIAEICWALSDWAVEMDEKRK